MEDAAVKPSSSAPLSKSKEDGKHRKALIGSPTNFWRHSTRTGFDLTHSTDSPKPSSSLTIKTTAQPITIAPANSALVIIDMQNFFLSPAFGRSTSSAGHAAMEQLIKHAIPAARKAGIRVVWMNWGLTEQDLEAMPPGVRRCFGFEAVGEEKSEFGAAGTEVEGGFAVDRDGNVVEGAGPGFSGEDGKERVRRGMGSECGRFEDEGGWKDAGRLLVKDSWNAGLYGPLEGVYEEGKKMEKLPDVWVHKNRMSGLWGAKGECEEFFEKEGIRTLFFAGVNTDQCVGGTMTDAFSKGYDCVLLSDGCGTSSPEYAQRCYEFNAARSYGFVTSCEELAKAVEAQRS